LFYSSKVITLDLIDENFEKHHLSKTNNKIIERQFGIEQLNKIKLCYLPFGNRMKIREAKAHSKEHEEFLMNIVEKLFSMDASQIPDISSVAILFDQNM